MSKLYTDSVHYNCKKSVFFLKFERNEIFFFFSIAGSNQRILSQSGGLDLNYHVLEYLMMFTFDFTDIRKLPFISIV